MNDQDDQQPRAKPLTSVGADPVQPRAFTSVAHLSENRRLIVRRSLMATAVGGALPIPVVDEYVTGRVRAGLFMRLAEARKVDLPSSSAEVLAEPKGTSAIKNATLTAATLVALRLAWRKFFAILALGRGAEDMATTFQTATLFDHYCAKLHVGGAIDRPRAARIRRAIHDTVEHASRTALVGAFREGGRVLGRSLLEAPRWVTQRLRELAERWVATRGNPDAGFDAGIVDVEQGPPGSPSAAEEARWLDRATRTVDGQLSGLGNGYLETLVVAFERNWRKSEEEAAAKAAADAAAAGGAGTPPQAV